jgi:hypothetical protein
VIPRLQAPSGKPTKLEYVSCAHLAAARDFLQQSLRSQVCQGSRNVASPLNDNQNQRDIFCRLCVCTYAPACVRMLVYLPLLLSDGKDSGHDTLIATSVSGKPSTINCRASFRPSIGTSGFQRTCTHTHTRWEHLRTVIANSVVECIGRAKQHFNYSWSEEENT